MRSSVLITSALLAVLSSRCADGAMLLADYTCTVTGFCPGTLTIEWSGAPPHVRQGILFSRQRGQYVIPQGVCAGTMLGLDERAFLVHTTVTDGGSGTISGWSSGSCGGHVQLVAARSCMTSTVAQIP